MSRVFAFAALISISTGVIAQTPQPAAPTHTTEVVLERLTGNVWHAIDSRLVLDPGDRVRFRVRTSHGGYLYVTNRNTSGAYDILFPGADTGSENKLEPGREYIVPANEGWFRIAGPPGQEIIYWLFSPIPLPGPDQRAKSHPQIQTSKPPALIPRCDASILRARGDCIDASAGPRELDDTTSLPDDFGRVRNLKSRDLVFIRQNDTSIVSSSAPLSGPVIYEFRLAHR